jgi:hypothetical protein
MKNKILFKETQKFTQWWLWLIVVGIFLIPIFQFNWAENIADQFTSDKIIPSVISLSLLVLFLSLKMTMTVTDTEIIVEYVPFITKKWNWSELKSAKVIDYGFVGGWGIRLWTDYGTVYNVKGSKGLHIKTADKQYVIGTQNEEELRSKIAHLLK